MLWSEGRPPPCACLRGAVKRSRSYGSCELLQGRPLPPSRCQEDDGYKRIARRIAGLLRRGLGSGGEEGGRITFCHGLQTQGGAPRGCRRMHWGASCAAGPGQPRQKHADTIRSRHEEKGSPFVWCLVTRIPAASRESDPHDARRALQRTSSRIVTRSPSSRSSASRTLALMGTR